MESNSRRGIPIVLCSAPQYQADYCRNDYQWRKGYNGSGYWAAVSLMSQFTQERVFPRAMLHESTIHFRSYTEEPMEVMGELQVIAAYNGQQRQFPLYIVPGSGPTLLGREWLQYLKLDWKQIATVTQDPLQELLNKHHRVFEDTLGTISNYTAMLHV